MPVGYVLKKDWKCRDMFAKSFVLLFLITSLEEISSNLSSEKIETDSELCLMEWSLVRQLQLIMLFTNNFAPPVV